MDAISVFEKSTASREASIFAGDLLNRQKKFDQGVDEHQKFWIGGTYQLQCAVNLLQLDTRSLSDRVTDTFYAVSVK